MIGHRNVVITFFSILSLALSLPVALRAVPAHGLWALLVWAALVSFSTVLLLHAFHYFEGLERVSAVDDFVSILLCLAVPAVVAKIGVAATLGAGALHYRALPAITGGIALLLAAAHKFQAAYQTAAPIRAYLRVLPRELEQIVAELAQTGLRERFELIQTGSLRGRLLQGEDIGLVIISRGAVRDFRRNQDVLLAYSHGATVMDWQDLLERLSQRVHLSRRDFWSYFASASPQTPLRRVYARLKLALEPLCAFGLLVLLSPLLLGVALGIALFMPGPVLYRQTRTGYRGRDFTLLKFRSMLIDAERDGARWCASPSEESARIPWFGRFLRAGHLDELPQLWNVLRGELSFIGPRPERPEFYEKLRAEVPLFHLRTDIRPGITGWAQVRAGYAASAAESLLKLEHDLYYIQKASPQLDIIILLKTAGKALLGQGGVPARCSAQRSQFPHSSYAARPVLSVK